MYDRKVLVLGATGMLGEEVLRTFSSNLFYQTFGTSRNRSLTGDNILDNVDLFRPDTMYFALNRVRPDVIINCTGLTKHVSNNVRDMICVNSLVPWDLASWASRNNALYIHISTDCVFSGKDGNYSEESVPDCLDTYGRTKVLGEVEDHLVIRTSFIGRESHSKRGLLEWFLSQEGTVKGYTKAIWSGVTARELARILDQMIRKEARGLYHVGGDVAIDKYSLLMMIKNIYKKDIDIVPDDSINIDRSLDIDKFKQLGIDSPSLGFLIAETKNV